ncbi:magnesium transporter [Atopobacter sp. AH10]|uniref:magnesium transporter n=1 Tax=Atopobacter sp. AH10 TaxID=2315861 RepID=UPI001F4923C7|nr:magnesium transporter [Atopobacter sp. AH10]
MVTKDEERLLRMEEENNRASKAYRDDILAAGEQGDRERFRDLFLKLHENDQVELFIELPKEKKARIINFLTPLEFSEIFDWMEQEDREESLNYLPKDYLREVFSYVADDNVVDFINGLEEDKRQNLLEMMKPKDRAIIERMLQHEAKTAGAIMTTEVITVDINDTVDNIIQTMRNIGHRAETFYYIYAVDEQFHLQGVVSIRELLLSPGNTPMKDLMNTQIVSVHVIDDQEDVAHVIQEYDLVAVPVITIDNVLLGIVTVDDVMDILEEEVTEDFHRFAGISTSDEEDDDEESVFQIAKHRVLWIVILIFLGLISANLIAMFESTISKVVALAAFMPIIMDSAGNVGTQSLAVSVRRLTMSEESEETFFSIMIKEFLAGALIGLAAGISIFFLSFFLYKNIVLSGIIAVSMWATLSVSTVIGYVVPGLFDRVGIDPAVASGPFITTINDACGLMIYFSLATYLLHHL